MKDMKWPNECPAYWMNIDLKQVYWAKRGFCKQLEKKIKAHTKNQ